MFFGEFLGVARPPTVVLHSVPSNMFAALKSQFLGGGAFWGIFLAVEISSSEMQPPFRSEYESEKWKNH